MTDLPYRPQSNQREVSILVQEVSLYLVNESSRRIVCVRDFLLKSLLVIGVGAAGEG